MLPLIYKRLCPNCGGDISSERLWEGLPCERCIEKRVLREEVCDFLKSGEMIQLCEEKKREEEFFAFFREKTGFSPNNLQRNWAKKFFLGNSFAMIAPTGVGKTTFGLLLAYFLASRGEKSYLLFPTQILVEQAYDRLKKFGVNEEDIVAYIPANGGKKFLGKVKERIAEEDFKILITTNMFLYRNIDLIPRGIYSFVFVDDIDSVLKSGRNIDRLLMLLNFTEKDISFAMKYIFKKRKLVQSGGDLSRIEHMVKRIDWIKRKKRGNLAVSSATSSPRSSRVNLFRELLDFEVGRVHLLMRNVHDLFLPVEPSRIFDEAYRLIEKFGSGGLIFFPAISEKGHLEQFRDFLRKRGVEAILYHEFEEKVEDFLKGKVKVIIAYGTYKNPIARGLDLPEVVRYAIFMGVPRSEIRINMEESPIQLFYLLMILIPVLRREGIFTEEIEKLRNIAEEIRNVEKIPEKYISYLKKILYSREVIERIRKSEDISLVERGGEFYFVVPDITGYIQASGRTSRLFFGGLSRGLSCVLVDDERAFNLLRKKIRWNFEEIEFSNCADADIGEILREIDRDRTLMKNPSGVEEGKDFFKTTMIVVESPNKARTIANFFGRALRRRKEGIDGYEIAVGDRYLLIVASKGHVCDLNKDEGYYGVVKKNEYVPVFEPLDENREKIIRSLRNFALEVEEIFIATDPDTEGEKIGFDLFLNLRPYNLNIRRSEFHEVTRKAFLKALSEAREMDLDLVKAQITRRVYDRWIGFRISQYIQKKFNRNTLSAGRVQTPVLEWIVKRYEESKKKIWVAKLMFDGSEIEFTSESKKDLEEKLQKREKLNIIRVDSTTVDMSVKPFTTDTLLSEAAKEFGFSPGKIMQIAQDLFEMGLITYHRTDSIRVSSTGIEVAREYIVTHFSADLFKGRSFSTAGGAHECIRPTRPLDGEDIREFVATRNQKLSPDHMRVYDLIFRRFIASQMREAKVLRERFKFIWGNMEKEESFITKIEDAGFSVIYPVETKKIEEGKYDLGDVKIYSRSAVSNYTFASIIREMKERGIGRPSTYAVTVEKLLERKYVVVKNGFLIPTTLGIEVVEALKNNEHFYRFVREEFTRELEKIMDKIEERSYDYQRALDSLYQELLSS